VHILHPIKSLKDWWYKPVARVEGMMPALNRLSERIESAKNEPHLDALRAFLIIVADWHDGLDKTIRPAIANLEEVDYGQHTAMIGLLQELVNTIILCGRSENGMNRTGREEPVLENYVFIGGIYGLPVNTLLFWKDKRGDTDHNSWKGTEWEVELHGTTQYAVVCRQARRFVTENGGIICDRIKEIGDLLALKK
jgi:hypothetical protein